MTLLTADKCFSLFGAPDSESSLVVWEVPADLLVHSIPKHIYCNKHMVAPLKQAMVNISKHGYGKDIITWDGCFNIRSTRGAAGVPSLHSWGLAIDINAAWNQFGKAPTMYARLVKCFTDAGFDWGGNFSRPDGMHFQLTKELVCDRAITNKTSAN